MEAFLKSGAELIDDACPFCDTAWDVQALREHVAGKLAEARTAAELKNSLLRDAKPLASELMDLESLAKNVAKTAEQLPAALQMLATTKWAAELKQRNERATSLADLEQSIGELQQSSNQISESVLEELKQFKARADALPEVSKEDEAREYLTICQERLEVYRETNRQHQRHTKHCEIAAAVVEAFNQSTAKVLTSVYQQVQQDFSEYYRLINLEDEPHFSGKLTPSQGKLGFEVDFYSRGFFPPAAYHSEGHQDSMGICLYLALMKHTLGSNFTFAVLDDVLMSVDSGHRREICALLKTQFPQTQFIITTHDEIW
ncbi:MAG: hypothetical protein L0Z53_17835, partial [Acidobacteriales bacterium]|nr:hypothetical protein [Terriglobales bacterium]